MDKNNLRNKAFCLKMISGALAALGLLASCDKDTPDLPDGPVAPSSVQTFRLRVESVGETSEHTGAETRAGRPLFSMSPKQTIERVRLIIVEQKTGEIFYQTEVDGWSDTENRVSAPYVEGELRGRETEVALGEGQQLKEDTDYIVYAVGDHVRSYGGYTAFSQYVPGDLFLRTEVATVPEGGVADEIFAGAEQLHVIDGKLMTRPNLAADYVDAVVTLRRQVAGVYGYFTGIPTQVGGEAVANLRLVAPRRNRSLIFGGFRTMEDPENFNREKVINGFQPRTDYDAALAGSSGKDAFVVFEMELKKWFPGAGELPLDENGDGVLDANDGNWQTDPELAEDGVLKLGSGTVFGSCFWIPVLMTEEDIAARIPTFQLQLLGEDERVLKSWNVLVRQADILMETRTVVTLGEDGRAVVRTEDNPATPLTYNIARNNLYSLGVKNSDHTVGEDEPINLAEGDDLVMDVNPEWAQLSTIIFH